MTILLIIVSLISFGFSESPLSDRYHTYEEIQLQLSNWNDEFGNNINPSYLNGGHIITDTYPENLFNEQKLLKYNLNGELNLIAQIHSSFFNQGEYKCDLHPRCNADYSKVAVDFCSQDGRKIAVFTI